LPRIRQNFCSSPETDGSRRRRRLYKRIYHIKKKFLIGQILFPLLLLPGLYVHAESIRVLVAGTIEVSVDKSGGPIPLAYNNSVLITLNDDIRFIKGVEFELAAPQRWPANRGTLAMALYSGLEPVPAMGVADIEARRVAFEPLPAKIQMVYQIPIRASHGMKSTPYVTVPSDVVLPSSFPVLFRIMPIIKGLSDELESMIFQFSVRPVLSDEGAIRLIPRYPEQLRGKPFTVLIDNTAVPNINEELLLKEGEHYLVVLSDDYRNETSRFMVERTKTLDINIDLQDPTPLVIFEAPANAKIFLDNVLVSKDKDFIPVEPGIHEAKIQIGDYTVTKTLVIERGKTYHIAMSVGIDVTEND